MNGSATPGPPGAPQNNRSPTSNRHAPATSKPWTYSPTTTTATAPSPTTNSATSTARSGTCRTHSATSSSPSTTKKPAETPTRALGHYQQSVHHTEARGDTYGAGTIRRNIALLLRDDGRAGDALHYARAALTNFEEIGPGAASAAARAEALIQELEREAAP